MTRVMPANVEKDLAREMYFRGEQPSEIAKQLGIPSSRVRQWSFRDGWKEQKSKVKVVVVEPQKAAISEVAQQFTRRVIAQSDRFLMKLERIDPVTLRDVKDAVQTLAALNTTGRKALGMDDENGGNSYRLYVASKPAINVESTLITCPSDPGTGGEGREVTDRGADTTSQASPLTTQADQEGLLEGGEGI